LVEDLTKKNLFKDKE